MKEHTAEKIVLSQVESCAQIAKHIGLNRKLMNKYKTTKELGTMRLIDADNLEKAIAQYFKSHIIDNSCTVDAVDCCLGYAQIG